MKLPSIIFKRQSLLTLALTSLGIAVSGPLFAKPFTQDQVRSTSHSIDQLVASHLQSKQLNANPVIDDASFARRAYVSIAGRIPTAEEAARFIDDPQINKRRELVDSLIQSPGYRSRMFNFWADLLRLQTNQEKFGIGWHLWIQDAVNNNMPYDELVRSMLAADGLATENPAVGYYLRDRNMLLDNVSNTVQVFLGNRIGCAQCHDHPFDDWTQKQYYELAAFTGGTTYRSDSASKRLRELTAYTMKQQGVTQPSGTGKQRSKQARRNQNKARQIARDYGNLFRDFRKNAIADDTRKQLRLPDDYHYNDGKPGDLVEAQTIFGASLDHVEPQDRRQAFAGWVTSSDNPYFTKVIVNRLWAEVFGRGIVDPLDDWSETTRISHPELLDLLCQVMKATDYDVQQFMRVLYHTRLFESAAAATAPARGKAYAFQGPVLRRMSAEELHDSFLVMEYGNRDDIVNQALTRRWDSYKTSVDQLFNMPLPQLVALNKAVDANEKKLLAVRSEAKKIREQALKAKAEGDEERARKLQQKAREVYSRSKKMERQGGDELMSMVMQRNLRVRGQQSLRASEQPAPYKAGSFMRQFGSSDRLTPDAGSEDASIPQALTLLNGQEINRVTDGRGKLASALRDAKTDADRLEVLFLTMYGCRPNTEERQQYESLTSTAAELRTLARAMMNSKRFLFVQ
ncbi:DUF1549 domain-containing protein [Verrucomicrobiaceae bacterium N1E253]|uniref:DUF1549 domain-containing protein n=1 Tax=Oceaniferula marina TaxID=2748318 RepID=A0A851GE46_9BACT|nr:DUF1549 domain-containing protein [Oceaniferula marina]NWK55696.1 DUF1549 domain-containing protein [Oceaniferula marina]